MLVVHMETLRLMELSHTEHRRLHSVGEQTVGQKAVGFLGVLRPYNEHPFGRLRNSFHLLL